MPETNIINRLQIGAKIEGIQLVLGNHVWKPFSQNLLALVLFWKTVTKDSILVFGFERGSYYEAQAIF